jgi:hypothetical protein
MELMEFASLWMIRFQWKTRRETGWSSGAVIETSMLCGFLSVFGLGNARNKKTRKKWTIMMNWAYEKLIHQIHSEKVRK